MKIIEGARTVQGSPEWLAWRNNGIGASEAPIVMGRSKFMTPYGLYRLKRGLDEPPPPNPYMLRGIKLEKQARKAYEKETGNIMVPMVAESSARSFMRASLDGLSPFEKMILEIKCPGEEAHSFALAGIVPPWYYDQLQHQLFVTEMDRAHYYSYDGEKGVLLEVGRDELRIREIIEGCERFWERVCRGVWSSDEWAAAAINWRLVQAELEVLKAREKIARQALISMIGNDEKKREGSGVLATRVPRRGEIDYEKAFAALGINPDALEAYRKDGTESFMIRESIKDDDIDIADACTPKKAQTGVTRHAQLDSFKIEF